MSEAERAGSRRRLIAIGPTPPPTHGVSVFTELLVKSLRELDLLAAHLDTRDARPLWNVGRLDFENVRLGVKHVFGLIRLLVANPGAPVYLPVSQGTLAFCRDAAFVWLARLWKRPVLIHVNGGAFHRFYAGASRPMKLLIRRTVRLASQAWVLTPSLRTCLEGLVEERRIRVLPNAVEDVPRPATIVDATSETTGRQEFRVLYLANLVPSKGCFTLIDALLGIGESSQPWHVRLVGDAEASTHEELLRRIDRLPLNVRVDLRGPRAGDEKNRELAWADVFVFPTAYPLEGQPLVLLEALSAGLPIISTRHAGIPETVRDGREGILVPPGDAVAVADALEALCHDPSRRSELGLRGRARYESCYRPEQLKSGLRRLLADLPGD